MPDDLINQAWHRNHIYDDSAPPGQTINVGPSMTNQNWAIEQIIRHVTFSLPVAYVRVPRGYVAGDPIPVENVIDIRPFFRSAELAYNERAAIAASINPNGNNPFLTQKHFHTNYWVDLDARISENFSQIGQLWTMFNSLQNEISANSEDIARLMTVVSGDDPTIQVIGPHEARIQSLEGSVAGGGGAVTLKIPKTVFSTSLTKIFDGALSPTNLGNPSDNNNSGKPWSLRITGGLMHGIPQNIPGEDIVGVYLTWFGWHHADCATSRLYTSDGPNKGKATGYSGGWTDGSTHLPGNVNSFFFPVATGLEGTDPNGNTFQDDVVVYTYTVLSNGTNPSQGYFAFDGYVYNQTVTV
jgi:hypothetical protein